MASTHPNIPVLDLAGTPGQVGAAHGEAQRDRIREYADRFIGWILSVSPMRLTSGGWMSDTGNAVSAAFPTRGAWVAAVTEWANANLTGAQRAQVLSGIKSDRIQTPGRATPANPVGQKDKP